MKCKNRWFSVSLAIVVAAVLAIPSVAMGEFAQPTSVVDWEDAYENDDTFATAKTLPAVSYHTIHEVDDHDIAVIHAEKGDVFTVEMLMDRASSFGNDDDYGDPDTEIIIYRDLGSGNTTEVCGNDDRDHWGGEDTYTSSLTFEATQTGTFYIDAHELDEDDRLAYWLYIQEGIGRRVAGDNRYATAIEASKASFPMNGVDWDFDEGEDPECVVIASGENYADALAGSAFAAGIEGTLLLTRKDTLPSEVVSEMERLWFLGYILGEDEQMTVYVLGGTQAISPAVVSAAGRSRFVQEVVRLSGDDRYETAAEIATEFDDYEGIDTTAYIVNGTAWADALALGSVAAYNDRPMMLTAKSDVPAATTQAITDLGITDVIVVGGTSVVDGTAYAELETQLGAGNVSRISGASRYETARLVAEHGVSEGVSADAIVLASGENWVDAMTGGPLAYWYEASLLLTPKDSLSSEVTKFMNDNGIPELEVGTSYGTDVGTYRIAKPSYMMGGSAAISDSVLEEWSKH